MANLAELDNAIQKLDDLWAACTDPKQKDAILTQRDNLDAQATKLADLTLKDGVEGLDDAITALNELSDSASKTKDKIEKEVGAIVTIADIINKATEATAKVAALVAKL